MLQKSERALNAHSLQVTVRRFPQTDRERTREVRDTESRSTSEVCDTDRFVQIAFHESLYAPNLPADQSAYFRPTQTNQSVFQTLETEGLGGNFGGAWVWVPRQNLDWVNHSCAPCG